MTDKIALLHAFPEGEHPVQMTVFKDVLYVATNQRIYRLSDNGKLYPVPVIAA